MSDVSECFRLSESFRGDLFLSIVESIGDLVSMFSFVETFDRRERDELQRSSIVVDHLSIDAHQSRRAEIVDLHAQSR